MAVLAILVGVPFIAVAVAIPLLWDRGISAVDLVASAVLYLLTAHAIGIGYHRLLTHRAFKAQRWLRITLSCLAVMAVEGDPITWVADHRRHHQYADLAGDPHSPWRFGTTVSGLLRGLVWAHVWWIFRNETTSKARFAPDLTADPDMARIAQLQPVLVAATFGFPAAIGWLATGTAYGALTAFFWAGLVRVGLLHHATWSVNSIAHAFGPQPFMTRDRSTNVWWLAVISTGEGWHNYHHADPTSARHGVGRYQLDSSARLIWLFERLGWAWDVRWPSSDRVTSLRSPGS